MKNIFLILTLISAVSLLAVTDEHVNSSKDEFQSDIHKFKKSNDKKCEREKSTLAYGTFYLLQKESDIIFKPGEMIPLSSEGGETKNVSTLDGQVLFTLPGDYLITFGVSADATTDLISDQGRIALALDGVYPQPGSNFTLNSLSNLVDLSTILHIQQVPALLTLVNSGNASFQVKSSIEEKKDVAAFISVKNINHFSSKEKNRKGSKPKIITTLASFYTEDQVNSPQPVYPPESQLVLNRTALSTPDVILLPHGVIAIQKAGDYYVNFGASIDWVDKSDQDHVFRLALSLNGELQLPSFVSSTDPSKIFSASTMLHVTEPSELKIINNGSEDIILSTSYAGDITAFLSLFKVNTSSDAN